MNPAAVTSPAPATASTISENAKAVTQKNVGIFDMIKGMFSSAPTVPVPAQAASLQAASLQAASLQTGGRKRKMKKTQKRRKTQRRRSN